MTERKAFLAYDVLPAAFEAQLDWLKDHGYTTILPRDLAAHWDEGRKLPGKPVILTFDDGTREWVTNVMPALEKRGMVAEFYLCVEYVDRGLISWDDVRSLADAGNGIGSHHVDHVQLAMLIRNRPARPASMMWRQVSRSREIIAREVGQAPDSIAYVGGGFNAELQRLAARAGYSTGRSILRGIVQDEAGRYTLRVVRPAARDDVVELVDGTVEPGLPRFTARMHGVTSFP